VIDAIIFGGRRATNVPLVVEARDWEHGVFMGATVSSEQTAAAEGTVGELRRDPFAMLPFCGYNMADYWSHWLDMGQRLRQTSIVPRIFQVNWFRKGSDGAFLWPGFGENSRVLEWILDRVDGRVSAVDSPIGLMPVAGGINVDGLSIDEERLYELFAVNPVAWRDEADSTEQFFERFGDRVPEALDRQLGILRSRLA
jgi:phosphoenolpyruvate carboxykinase (GTP)